MQWSNFCIDQAKLQRILLYKLSGSSSCIPEDENIGITIILFNSTMRATSGLQREGNLENVVKFDSITFHAFCKLCPQGSLPPSHANHFQGISLHSKSTSIHNFFWNLPCQPSLDEIRQMYSGYHDPLVCKFSRPIESEASQQFRACAL